MKENRDKTTPVLSIVGFSGSGKTTLIVGLIAALSEKGIHVGTIKHDAHGFEMDRPGKDSWRHKQAGAVVTIVSSRRRIGLVMDVDHDHEPVDILKMMPEVDIILIEGYKRAELPKIEVFRPETQKPPACKDDRNLIAIVSDAPFDRKVPCFKLDDITGLTDFVIERFNLDSSV